jgi:hypothetical protein
MIESSYTWGEPFQLRLLALLLREPEKTLDLVEQVKQCNSIQKMRRQWNKGARPFS